MLVHSVCPRPRTARSRKCLGLWLHFLKNQLSSLASRFWSCFRMHCEGRGPQGVGGGVSLLGKQIPRQTLGQPGVPRSSRCAAYRDAKAPDLRCQSLQSSSSRFTPHSCARYPRPAVSGGEVAGLAPPAALVCARNCSRKSHLIISVAAGAALCQKPQLFCLKKESARDKSLSFQQMQLTCPLKADGSSAHQYCIKGDGTD